MSMPSSPSSPARTRRPARRRQASYPSPDLRVSDAERAQIADCLSRHYADGRLDQAEFGERMDQAMRAKTQSDFSGLLADLPDIQASDSRRRRRDRHDPPAYHGQGGSRRRPGYRRIGFLALVAVITAAAGLAMAGSYVPWLIVAILAFIGLRHAR
jgi:Domain of unknown function (DUF1707)